MAVQRIAIDDAEFERTPGYAGNVFQGNVVDQRHGGPISIGYGRYFPNETLEEDIAVDDVMIILEGRISVTSDAGTVVAGPQEMIYMPKGSRVTIRSHDEGALTAYVTYPHWQTEAG